jgi:hypothetical protein
MQGAEEEGVIEVEARAGRVHACSELFRSQGIVRVVEDLVDVKEAWVPFHLVCFRLRYMSDRTQVIDPTIISRRENLALGSRAVGVTDHWGTRDWSSAPNNLGEFGTVPSSVGIARGTETVVTVVLVCPVRVDPIITLKAGNKGVTNLRPEQDILGLCAAVEAFDASVDIGLDDDTESSALDQEPNQAPDLVFGAAG